jgi:hypothetical protein
MPAVPAIAVDPSQPRDAYSRSQRQLGRRTPHHLTHDLVAGNDPGLERRQLALDNVQVRPANTAGPHTDQKLS